MLIDIVIYIKTYKKKFGYSEQGLPCSFLLFHFHEFQILNIHRALQKRLVERIARIGNNGFRYG